MKRNGEVVLVELDLYRILHRKSGKPKQSEGCKNDLVIGCKWSFVKCTATSLSSRLESLYIMKKKTFQQDVRIEKGIYMSENWNKGF